MEMMELTYKVCSAGCWAADGAQAQVGLGCCRARGAVSLDTGSHPKQNPFKLPSAKCPSRNVPKPPDCAHPSPPAHSYSLAMAKGFSTSILPQAIKLSTPSGEISTLISARLLPPVPSPLVKSPP
ncbi:hypothetical protein JZ751_019546 [Albula glossodonta]|uniref:Uncharacterized protein n=1 Tax=Albula glossodonta TaxID=121402 RepID=A0A8T2MSD1_9TELE|nr:hypothetical protein JZ751_019546 [Albula glossodonta]